MMMVLCGSWLWQQCSGASAALVLAAVCIVAVSNNGRGWWLCSDGGCRVMVGVVAATMAEGEAALGKKKREKNCHNTVQFIILSYVISKYI